VFESKVDALKAFKSYKDARLKSFKTRGEALKYVKNGTNPVTSILDSILKCEYADELRLVTHGITYAS
jgi:hypothetical protein